MASGIVHDKSIRNNTRTVFNVASIPIVVINTISYGNIGILIGLGYTFIFTLAFWFSGMYLSPDLDHHVVTNCHKRWGIFRLLWIPYQKLIPCHRHWLSHGVIVGTLLRLLYLIGFITPIVFYLNLEPDVSFVEPFIYIFLGAELASCIHYYLDFMVEYK